jgi:hypothetical protein
MTINLLESVQEDSGENLPFQENNETDLKEIEGKLEKEVSYEEENVDQLEYIKKVSETKKAELLGDKK